MKNQNKKIKTRLMKLIVTVTSGVIHSAFRESSLWRYGKKLTPAMTDILTSML